MESLLVKIFATALALSQVTTTPDAVKTEFNRDRDQPQVAQLLRAGCTHMIKAFDIENINLDDLIATALDDPQAIGESKAFRGINFADLQIAYRQFCKNEQVEKSVVDLLSRSGEAFSCVNLAIGIAAVPVTWVAQRREVASLTPSRRDVPKPGSALRITVTGLLLREGRQLVDIVDIRDILRFAGTALSAACGPLCPFPLH
jgi:hypothetical protein